VHLGSSYTVLEREGKVEGEMGGGEGGEVGKKRGAIRVVDESHVAEVMESGGSFICASCGGGFI